MLLRNIITDRRSWPKLDLCSVTSICQFFLPRIHKILKKKISTELSVK